ncbi:pyruvate kinase [Clostridium botulinum]|uniref:Pyruvate kinase n=1 Tax=Clostridium botulinum C/D str. DC5 TaxID=1443128 RepID=A0A0A0IBU8_CLOBO|nr:DUF3006 domain-containing protein [Clostridium botulinum]KEI01969.1 pyruvate kinase [Clostridium botulinum C/D str. BKT75002]KEI10071.1 pyruvate kinase [Clostridium botulinum C/D str. BKT2873]KGM98174.1 pyruvate kinase [Clostridium botulinum D str. CCUG 7971]KGM98934.1 pyruvate kinase [Clostridium botulinum C/D str. DC5]KOC50383.1 pyruvate kinase [Clostridium botulinum]
MFGVIDRFEEEFAVVELDDRKIINILKEKLPKEAKEGYVIKITDESIIIDYEETEKRKKEIEELAKDLFE